MSGMAKSEDGFPDTLILRSQLEGEPEFNPIQKLCCGLLLEAVACYQQQVETLHELNTFYYSDAQCVRQKKTKSTRYKKKRTMKSRLTSHRRALDTLQGLFDWLDNTLPEGHVYPLTFAQVCELLNLQQDMVRKRFYSRGVVFDPTDDAWWRGLPGRHKMQARLA